MSTNDSNDEVDIYGDLPEFNLEASIQKLEAENQVLTQKVKELTARVAELEIENNDLNRMNTNLKANISSLVKTAQEELQRKDATVAELRQERENLFFRRQKPGQGSRVRTPERNRNGVEQGGESEKPDDRAEVKGERTRRSTRQSVSSSENSSKPNPDKDNAGSINPSPTVTTAERHSSAQKPQTTDSPRKSLRSSRRNLPQGNSDPAKANRLPPLPVQTSSENDFQPKRPRRTTSSATELVARRDSSGPVSASSVLSAKLKATPTEITAEGHPKDSPQTPTTATSKEESSSASPKRRTRRTPTSRLYVKTRSSARISAKQQNSTQETSNDDMSLLEALQLEEKSQHAFANSPLPDILSPLKDYESSMSPRPCPPTSTPLLPSSTLSSGISSLLTGALIFDSSSTRSGPRRPPPQPPSVVSPAQSGSPVSGVKHLQTDRMKPIQSSPSNGPPARAAPSLPRLRAESKKVTPLSSSTAVSGTSSLLTGISEPSTLPNEPPNPKNVSPSSMPKDPRKLPSASAVEKAPKQVLRLGVLSYKEDAPSQKNPPNKEKTSRPEANPKDSLPKDAPIANAVSNKKDIPRKEEICRKEETKESPLCEEGRPQREEKRRDGEVLGGGVLNKREIARKEETKDTQHKGGIPRRVERKREEELSGNEKGAPSYREKVSRKEGGKLEEDLHKEEERPKEIVKRRGEDRRKEEEAERREKEAKTREEDRRKEEARIGEEERRSQEAKIREDERRRKEAKVREEERRREEAKSREEERRKEEARIREEERRKEDARIREEERRKEDARIREEERRREEAKSREEERRKEDAKIREEERRKEDARIREEERRREEAKSREEERRKEEAKIREEERRKEDVRIREEERRREEAKSREEERRKEDAKIREEDRRREELRIRQEERKKEPGSSSSSGDVNIKETSSKQMNGHADARPVNNSECPTASAQIDGVGSDPSRKVSLGGTVKGQADSSALQCDFTIRRRTRVQMKVILKTPPTTPSHNKEVATVPPALSAITNDVKKVGNISTNREVGTFSGCRKVAGKPVPEVLKEVPSKVRDQSPRDSQFKKGPKEVSPRGQFSIPHRRPTTDFRRRARSRSRSPPRHRGNMPSSYLDHRQSKVLKSPPHHRYSRKEVIRMHNPNSRRSRSLSPRLYLQRKHPKNEERLPLFKLPPGKKDRERMLFGKSPNKHSAAQQAQPQPRMITIVKVKRNKKTIFEDSKECPSTNKPQSSGSASRTLSIPAYFREKHPDSNPGESESESGAFSSGTESSHSKDSDDSYRPRKKRKKIRTDNPKSKKLCRDENR